MRDKQTFILWDDHLRPSRMNGCLNRIQSLPVAETWQVTIEPYREPRSGPQNRYLWGGVYPTVEQATGNSKETIHEYLCGEYFGWREASVFGRRKVYPLRTTTTDENGKRKVLTVPEFIDFVDFILARMAEHGIAINEPLPPELRTAA